MKNHKRSWLAIIVSTGTLAISPEGLAQNLQRTPDDAPAARTLEEIRVVARKRGAAESAQSVPVSLSAVSGNEIEASFATNLTDIGQFMPNVRLDDAGVFPGTANYSIRGMGFISTIASTEPTVGVFVDGIYLGSTLGGAPDTFDLESIEVLRGPQGTLFGRNVTGGAVVMNSRRPDGEFDALVRLGVGSGGRVLVGGSVEGSLADTLAGKVYAQFSDYDGDFRNKANDKRFGGAEDQFIRPILRWQPNERTDITLIGEYGHKKGDGAPARVLDDFGTLVTDTGMPVAKGRDNLLLNQEGKTDIEWSQLMLEANWEIGPGTLTSVSGYRDVQYYAEGEEGTAEEIVNSFNEMDQDQFSQELRYAATALNDRLNYTVGVYYFEQSLSQAYRLDIFSTPTFMPYGEMDHKTGSVFAQGDYEFADNWFLTLGARYTWEEKSVDIARGNDCTVDFQCEYTFSDSQTWNNLSPKVGLSWTPYDGLLTYLSWTKGFRSGGYNTRTTGATESPGPYDEETVEAWEVGVKSEFLDRRARVNLALFHNSFDDLQRSVFDPNTFANAIQNAAEANIKGVELELAWLPTDRLSLAASIGYTDATYDRFDLLDVDGDGSPDPELAKGLQLVRAPKWTYAASAAYDYPLENGSQLSGRVAYSHTSRAPLNDSNSRFLSSYQLVDASLAWTSPSERYQVSLWGKNLTNEMYATTGALSALYLNIYQSAPRSYGVEAIFRL